MASQIEEPTLYDVAIIGAGPCGLAVAARLRERTPSAIFTDDEHQRYHWIRKQQTSIKNPRNGRIQHAAHTASAQYSMLVLDSTSDRWLGRWQELFGILQIDELRSPSFFHVDPGDRDALLAFAHETGRMNELRAIKGVVGMEVSKHRKKKRITKHPREPMINERDRNDYYTPSANLFTGHCEQCVARYSLVTPSVRKDTVLDIAYGDFVEASADHKSFHLTTDKRQYFARTVVLAIGGGNKPTMPGHLPGERTPGACHALQMDRCPDAQVGTKIRAGKAVHIMVVGGGLTSAQVSDLVLQRGATKVWHIMRGPVRIMHFDLDLPWLGKFKNEKQAEFWTADTEEERLEMIKQARGGGSITPKYKKILDHHINRRRLESKSGTSVVSKTWNEQAEAWHVTTDPPIEGLPPIDYIYYATGLQTDVQSIDMLDSMRGDYPIKYAGGLPCLNDELMWSDDVPLFVNGKLASLQIGPGAANLSGARVGAERIAWGVEEMLKHQKPSRWQAVMGDDVENVRVNRFGSLTDSDG